MSIYANCINLGNHETVTCAPVLGGVQSVAYASYDTTITDWSDDAQWATAIANGTAKVGLENVLAEQTALEPVTIPNINSCGATDILVGNNFTVNITDYNASAQNNTFYANLPFWKNGYVILKMCGEETIRVYSRVTFTSGGGTLLDKTNRVAQQYDVMAKGYVGIGVEVYELADAPTTIFA